MTRRDWWLGILVVTLAIVLHAAVPRYEWRQLGGEAAWMRVDRWTGTLRIGTFMNREWVERDVAELTR